MKKTSLILSILLLFATNAWAKEACDNNDFRKKYKSYCEGIESSLNESVICSGSFKNQPEYKEYCAKQGYVTTKKKSSIVNKKISTGEINTYFGVEKDKAIKQIVALSKNQLSTEDTYSPQFFDLVKIKVSEEIKNRPKGNFVSIQTEDGKIDFVKPL